MTTATSRDPDVGLVKLTTSITETGNSATSQATIGELIDYTVTATLPNGTTFRHQREDHRYPELGHDPAADRPGDRDPERFAAARRLEHQHGRPDDHGQHPRRIRGSAGSDHTVVISFQTRVADVSANVRGQSRTNQANISGPTARPAAATRTRSRPPSSSR